jgi:Sec7 domain
MRFIYIKAILQVRIMFAAHDEFMRVLTENQSSKEIAVGGGAQAQAVVGAPSSFSIEELEIVLESLADLLADLGFLPSLFASFDCDPSKGDIVQPLVKYLTSCMRYTLVSEPAELNISGLLDVGGLIEQCYAQMSFTLSQRDVLKVAASSLGSGSASGRGLDGPSEADNIKKQLDVKNLAVKLRLTRLAKGVLAEAALRFSTKPQDGLKFLQAKGVLPSPLTPASVAKFLRIAPGLPNECTGSFLGELGKDNPSYEADGKAFHREVLLCYVRSFELKGQTVLNCMRIFLSAFRLPGEAQQIDRILVAFSEYCHAGSIEGNSGLLENPEVTYLLTFSMIMLNTDLHNPNVRADRKMTIAQFIKNNSFYGAELNQTKNIPKEYLEAVYASLSQVPLRTERNDLNASITPEMWMDLQLQATINTEKGLMLSTSYSLEMTRSMTRKVVDVDSEVTVEADIHAIGENGTISTKVEPDSNTDPLPSTSDADKIADVARRLLTDSSAPVDGETMALCERFRGMHWLVDEDFLSCTFQDFFGVAVCPFFMHRFVVAPCARTVGGRQSAIGSSPHEHGAGAEGDMAVGSTEVVPWRTRHASVRALGVGIDSSLLLLGLLHSNGMQASIEGLLLLFADIVGISVEVIILIILLFNCDISSLETAPVLQIPITFNLYFHTYARITCVTPCSSPCPSLILKLWRRCLS